MSVQALNYLEEAYKILFSRKPENLEQWQIAKEFLENFDGRPFVDDPRKKLVVCAALAFIIEYVVFPVGTGCEGLTRRAIGFLTELDSRISGDDFNAGLARYLLRQYTAADCLVGYISRRADSHVAL